MSSVLSLQFCSLTILNSPSILTKQWKQSSLWSVICMSARISRNQLERSKRAWGNHLQLQQRHEHGFVLECKSEIISGAVVDWTLLWFRSDFYEEAPQDISDVLQKQKKTSQTLCNVVSWRFLSWIIKGSRKVELKAVCGQTYKTCTATVWPFLACWPWDLTDRCFYWWSKVSCAFQASCVYRFHYSFSVTVAWWEVLKSTLA